MPPRLAGAPLADHGQPAACLAPENVLIHLLDTADATRVVRDTPSPVPPQVTAPSTNQRALRTARTRCCRRPRPSQTAGEALPCSHAPATPAQTRTATFHFFKPTSPRACPCRPARPSAPRPSPRSPRRARRAQASGKGFVGWSRQDVYCRAAARHHSPHFGVTCILGLDTQLDTASSICRVSFA